MPNNKNIPKDYFSSLPGKIFKSIETIEDDIITVAPLLSKIGNDPGYKVPKNYFNNLVDDITENLPKVRTRRIIPARWLSIAASILVLFSCYVLFLSDDSSFQDSSIDDLAMEEVLDYYLDYPEEIEDQVLIDLDSEEFFIHDLDEFSDSEIDFYIESIIDEFSDEEIEELF